MIRFFIQKPYGSKAPFPVSAASREAFHFSSETSRKNTGNPSYKPLASLSLLSAFSVYILTSSWVNPLYFNREPEPSFPLGTTFSYLFASYMDEQLFYIPTVFIATRECLSNIFYKPVDAALKKTDSPNSSDSSPSAK